MPIKNFLVNLKIQTLKWRKLYNLFKENLNK
jgi:hypothetical protein